ncbi:hypothetical protein DL96DRAFT_1704702 [Flagelloscypha sp. PMI_526]|nr:hypothetical protein DL96DRAFT_1704702 [Flagelloscypha sp. PMI_526]
MAAINGNGAGSPSLSDESCITILDASRHFYTLSDDELTRTTESKKLEIEHTLPAAYSLLAPIRVLPAELLLEVFGWVIFSDTVLDTTKLPTIATLLATCSAWHSMICMVPDFWTTWEIRIPTSRFEEHFQRSPFAEFLEIALGRSQRSPLIINIFALVPIPHRTMEVVLTHGHHIKHLGIYTPHHIGSYAPVNDEAQVPALTTLETLDLPSKWFSLGHATAELNYEASFVDMERAPSISLFEHLLTARSLKNLRA